MICTNLTEVTLCNVNIRKLRDKAQKDRRFRTVEGAQWNIDRCMDELYKIQKDTTT